MNGPLEFNIYEFDHLHLTEEFYLPILQKSAQVQKYNFDGSLWW